MGSQAGQPVASSGGSSGGKGGGGKGGGSGGNQSFMNGMSMLGNGYQSNGQNNMPGGVAGMMGVMSDPYAGLDEESKRKLRMKSIGDAMFQGSLAMHGNSGYSPTPRKGWENLALGAQATGGSYQTALLQNAMGMRQQGQIGSEDQMIGEVDVTGRYKGGQPDPYMPPMLDLDPAAGMYTPQGVPTDPTDPFEAAIPFYLRNY